MVERGRGPGLLLEPLDASGIEREVGGQELQGNLTTQAQLRSEPHLAHASAAKRAHDLVVAQTGAGAEGHGMADYTARSVTGAASTPCPPERELLGDGATVIARTRERPPRAECA